MEHWARVDDVTKTDPGLLAVLEESRRLGFLGPGPVEPQIDHASSFLDGLTGRHDILDLGSGGGLPGLVLATRVVHARFVLLDAQQRRCSFLTRAVQELEMSDRVSVELGRAEDLARRPDLRGQFDAVVARSFGQPAVAAECAVGFLHGPGAVLLISEPPTGSTERWPTNELIELGLSPGERWTGPHGTIQQIDVIALCPERYPRRVGVPTKRPLFHVEQVEGA